MSERQAIEKAIRLAKKTGKVYFVVYECADEGFQVANEYDLDTWFAGCSDSAIRFCSADV